MLERFRRRERLDRGLRIHLPRLFGYALSLTGEREKAQDLVQNCAMNALSAKRVPEDDAALRAWLFKILRNCWIDQYRQAVDLEVLGEELPPSDLSANEARLIDDITVRQALEQLSPSAREIITLVDLAGFTYMEAAELLEVPVGTVMSRISRARLALHSLLQHSNVRPLRLKDRARDRA
ncbi:MAG: RNA polymerase sigma factor [Alphaproteobacteria bacterium]|nr:RNA polymerase sigma factor [Alphaproteobacteria bacterium]MBU0796842.1 RNA polymerase sigma factor [Alphaproteobacteria bacterium]MBU0885800.1 RNA polymerase sigma factor [Alphaproteobacteria bacterium]MBU1812123.1 RNA polymerase sigma factor [Alphaproteobacteria bacterium]MBU2090265.1 RNA polymerase sigma factor [Alphaproteobacteria bacterium]